MNENAKQINILSTKRPMEEKMIIILKGSMKQTFIKQSPTFPSFSIVIDCCVSVFSLFLYKIKRFVKSKRLKRFHHQAFILSRIEESLKILIETFRQKFLFLTLFWLFKTTWNLILSPSTNHDDRHRAPSIFEISGSACARVHYILFY